MATRDETKEQAQRESMLRKLLRDVTRLLQFLTLTQGASATEQVGPLVQGRVATAEPAYATDTVRPLSLTTRGGVRTAPLPELGNWKEQHIGGAAAQATITKAAAGAGVKNVCTALTVSLASGAVPTVGVVTFVLRDAASGGGNVKWACKMSLPAVSGESRSESWHGEIEGSANTEMTLETVAATPANVEATVSLSGFTRS